MRAQASRASHEEEEESVFVSMTDMTVGFLFIIMILLAFFASQMRSSETVPKPLYEAAVQDRDHWRELAEDRLSTIERLEARLAVVTAERDRLKNELSLIMSELEDARERIDMQQDRIEELEALIVQLKESIVHKDKTIAELKRRLEELEQADPLEEYLSRVSAARRQILIRLRDAIREDFPGLQVTLSVGEDALQFQGEGLFAKGSPRLATSKAEIVAKLSQRLNEVLPCYTLGPRSHFDASCNPAFALVESVQIEGHTDNDGPDTVNRPLSTNRANATFFAMTKAAPRLMEYRNWKGQPVLSVAAYGPDRPIATNDTREGQATNRRIDLRFIMVTPRKLSEIEDIRKAFETLGEVPE